MIIRLVLKSLWHRRFVSAILVLSLSLSVLLAMSVERIRLGAKEGFSEAISQVDLIVGARTGPLSLLLYSVFRIGNATNNILYSSYEEIAKHPSVLWSIPLSLGDSHRGFSVVATNESFYKHYRFRRDRSIEFEMGAIPSQIYEVAVGSEVAKRLGYQLNDKIILSHGRSGDGPDVYVHEDKPFRISGILKRTNTPIDSSLYISLESMEAIHFGWENGVPGDSTPQKDAGILKVESITSFLLRTKNRIDSVYLQRDINSFTKEPLMAVAPGVVMGEFWNSFQFFETTLQSVAWIVALTALLGLFLALMISVEIRQREMLVMRAIGLNARTIISMLLLEVSVLIALSIGLGSTMMSLLFLVLKAPIEKWTGLSLAWTSISSFEWTFLAGLLVFGTLSAFLPALRLYRKSLIL